MPKAKVNDVEIYYELQGQGPALVLIDGYTCTISMWDQCIKYLSHSHTLLLLDNRGSGRTQSPNTPYTIDQMADDVIQLVRKIGFKTYSLLGHSMGGAIAQTVAYRDMHSVDKLIIANSSSKFSAATRSILHFFLNLRKEGVSDGRLNEGILPLIYSEALISNPQKIYDLIHEKELYPQTFEGQKNQLYAVDHFNSQPILSEIKSKTLIIGSEDDRLTPFKESEFLAEHIPHSSLYLFKNMGHFPLIEEPEKFSQIVTEFLLPP